MWNYLKLICAVIFSLVLIAHASIRNEKSEDENFKKQSGNSIPAKEDKNSEEQLYYLPSKTELGISDVLKAAGGLTTSPPQLTIQPDSIKTNYQESTAGFHENFPIETEYYEASAEGQCVSETPVHELESHLLIPSSGLVKDRVIMSGHLEIASKTSSVEEGLSEVHNFVSEPSIALQGTILHSHTVSDL